MSMRKGTRSNIPATIRKLGSVWGVFGVMLLLGFAVYRLLPFAAELSRQKLTLLHVAVLIIWCFVMVYFEGYKAFGQQFAPRVVARAGYLAGRANWPRLLFAPLFCVGYFGAPRKRIVSSIALFVGIVIVIVLIRFVPQPWRGIIDSGVVLGLLSGIFFLAFYSYKAIRQQRYFIDAEVV